MIAFKILEPFQGLGLEYHKNKTTIFSISFSIHIKDLSTLEEVEK
jgi:hypothetical protein